jgi:hypothetical protein
MQSLITQQFKTLREELQLPMNSSVAINRCEHALVSAFEYQCIHDKSRQDLISTHANLVIEHSRLLIDHHKLKEDHRVISELYANLLEDGLEHIRASTRMEKMKKESPEKYMSLKFDVDNNFSLCDLGKFKFDGLNEPNKQHT